MKEGYWLIQENAPFAEVWTNSKTEGLQFKGITTIIISHSKSDGSVKNAIMNGTKNTNQLRSGKEVQKKASSILSTEAFRDHVRTLALQDLVQAWKESEVDFFSRSLGLQTNSGQLSFSWKTYQPLGPAELNEWGKNWPQSGMIVGGILYRLRKSERLTKEIVGSYLPTPSASSYGSNKGGSAGRVGKERISLDTMARKSLWPTPNATDYKGPSTRSKGKDRPICDDDLPTRLNRHQPGPLNPTFVEYLMGFPLGWTELNASAIQWFRFKREKPL